MTDKFFVHCSEMGYETYATAKEAKEEAQNRIDLEQENASEGWHENVETIVWGEIKETSEMCNKRTPEQAEKEGILVDSTCDFVCDYELKAILD